MKIEIRIAGVTVGRKYGRGLFSILPSVIGDECLDREYKHKREVHTSKGHEGPRNTRKPFRVAVQDGSHEREPPKKQIDN